MAASADKWMEKAKARMQAKGTVGSLHKEAGVKPDKKIPDSKLSALSAKADSMGGEKGAALKKKLNFARNAGG